MKYISTLLFIMFVCFASAFSQIGSTDIDTVTVNEITFETPESMPEFPGGEAALYKYLSSNIVYPEMAKEAGISGKVYVRFTIDQEGNVSDVKILKGVNQELNNEALRVVKKMPKWTPGMLGGKAVKCLFNLPISFVLH